MKCSWCGNDMPEGTTVTRWSGKNESVLLCSQKCFMASLMNKMFFGVMHPMRMNADGELEVVDHNSEARRLRAEPN